MEFVLNVGVTLNAPQLASKTLGECWYNEDSQEIHSGTSGGYVLQQPGETLYQVRGWGCLSSRLKDEELAAKVQDAMGEELTAVINSWSKEPEPSIPVSKVKGLIEEWEGFDVHKYGGMEDAKAGFITDLQNLIDQ